MNAAVPLAPDVSYITEGAAKRLSARLLERVGGAPRIGRGKADWRAAFLRALLTNASQLLQHIEHPVPRMLDAVEAAATPPASDAYAAALELLIELLDARRKLMEQAPAAFARFEVSLVRSLFGYAPWGRS
jgi:hypothetical protein